MPALPGSDVKAVVGTTSVCLNALNRVSSYFLLHLSTQAFSQIYKTAGSAALAKVLCFVLCSLQVYLPWCRCSCGSLDR